MKQLTKREKILALAVGCIVFLGVNLFLLGRFMQNQSELRALAAQKNGDLRMMEELCKARGNWVRKDEWLSSKQPKLTNEGTAGVQLLDYIKDHAKRCDVVLENPAIGTPLKNPKGFTAVPVNIETKSSWESLVRFLSSVQQPDQFIVFENANLQIDSADQTRMRGKFRIARWYAAP